MQFLQAFTVVGVIYTSFTLVSAQVASLCRSNERFLSCGGCQKTCRNPVPACAAVCREGCYCPEDLVRNDTGECIPLSNCPSTHESYKDETSEPRSVDLKCPKNEEYRFCEPCNRTCDNPDPICPAQCARGCFCLEGLLRDKDGTCVEIQQCKKDRMTAYTASSLFAAEMSMITHELTVEDCSPEEEYLSCGWCEPTCSEPQPKCPIGVCTRGCLCRPPLVRYYSGMCVEPKDCLPQKCPDPSEEYVCRYGCETRCDRRDCAVRPRGCSLGCHCKLGLLRDATGKCVKPDHC